MTDILPDAGARRKITEVLDRNLVVEAAAGTGKTTCLVARVVELIQAGALRGEARFAAVTFTVKAANELKERLRKEIDRRAADPGVSPERRALLDAGRRALADCHIGTIHSFCARLLRERPVEAGVNPDFVELDGGRDGELRLRAWDTFARRLAAGRHPDLADDFRTFDLDMDTLGGGFLRFAEFPDVEAWPGDGFGTGEIDLASFRKGLGEFADGLGGYGTLLDGVDPESDEIIPVLQTLNRRRRRGLPAATGDAFRLCGLFRKKPKFIQRAWMNGFGCSRDDAKERGEIYRRFYDGTVLPFVTQCRAAVYGAALRAYRHAEEIYDELRRNHGGLNFQDLLMRTAGVLREHADVRREFARRYSRLLVDEVQDTDPVQAEILMLLASADAGEKDWRRAEPRAGALFVVGDPKQSIYRFRRADVVVYQELKRRITGCGGEALELVANFRSRPAVLDWVNGAFAAGGEMRDNPEAAVAAGRFTAVDTPYSPAYIPLLPGRIGAAAADLTGVFRLETLARKNDPVNPTAQADVLADEAARIAAFIRDAVDRGRTVPDGEGVRPARAGDFMIVTYNKKSAPVYAAALGRMGLECEMSAEGPLAASPVLAMLRAYVAAIANPDDPVAVLAVLRGPLYGASDRELYRWKKSGGRFLFPVPGGRRTRDGAVPDNGGEGGGEGKDDGEHARIREALDRLRRHHRLFRHVSPVESLRRIADDLGLWAYAALGDDPSEGTGVLNTMLELLRAESAGAAGPGDVLERFDRLMERYEGDVMPAAPAGGDAVRVMNAHKTKGLEAPVVFLACTMGVRARAVDFAVERDADAVTGGMVLARGEHGNVVVACPAGWDAMAEREERFLRAERTRLNYVAATRAGSMLVVSVHPKDGKFASVFLPNGDAALVPDKLQEPRARPEPTASGALRRVEAGVLEALPERRRRLVAAVTAATYRMERPPSESFFDDAALFGGPADASPPVPAEGAATELTAEEAARAGEVLHRLLESGGEGGAANDRAAELLREFELPAALAEEAAGLVRAVRGSGLWRRAAASERCFREVPFTIMEASDAEAPGAPDEEPALRRGVIDLVFWEGGGWVVVDYKTGRLASGVTPVQAAARYAGQLNAYARAWERATGERVADALVFFVRAGEWVSVFDGKEGGSDSVR